MTPDWLRLGRDPTKQEMADYLAAREEASIRQEMADGPSLTETP